MSGKRTRSGLWHEQVPVKLTRNGSKAEIPVSVYTRPSTTAVESFWALGFGAGSMAVRNVIKAQQDYRLAGAAIILPYHKVPYEHMEGFTNEAIPQVLAGISGSREVRLGGDSRGAGAAIRGAAEAPELIRAAGFLEPSFIGKMGDTPSQSVAQLALRLGVLNPPRLREPFHPGTIQTAYGIGKELVTLAVTQPANARKAVELVVDPSVAERTVSALGKIVDAGVPARVWYGEDDKV
ncbi:MAG TPA: hypothetical protein VLF62_01670, partial [Candidatus Saccharimonadales bacterium]|nr:hypothetical protein [Candidatus Saccharimonadales bacterium]